MNKIMICTHCGKQLPDGARFCAGCGASLAPVETSEEEILSGLSSLEQPTQAPDDFDAELAAIRAVLNDPAPLTPEVPEEEYEEAYEEAPPKKSRKGLIIALSALITAIVLGVGGWLIYSHLQTASQYDEACALRNQGYLEDALDAFEQLDDYDDSQSQAWELSEILEAESALKWQEYDRAIGILEPMRYVPEAGPLLEDAYRMRDYHNALDYLESGDYDQAREAFFALGDYLDSKDYAETKVTYLQAQAEAEQAEAAQSAEGYLQAGQRFLTLNDYEDAQVLASDCYLQAALLYLAAGDAEAAQACTAAMSQADQKTFTAQFNQTYADEDLLKAWNSALILRSELSQKGSYNYSEEYTALEAYLERDVLDSKLETSFADYMELLEKQQALVNYDGTVSKYVDWLKLEYDRVTLVETLIEKYDILAKTPKLQSHYLSQGKVIAAYCQIEESIQKQLMKVSASQNADGSYYVPYKNDTGIAYTLVYTQYFYSGGLLVKQDSHTVELSAGESVKIPVVFPEDSDSWDSWRSGYSYSDLKL